MNSNDIREINISIIRKATLECFLELGLNSTTYEDIAQRSGLTTRTVRRYFQNMNALVTDTIENAGYDYLKAYVGRIMDGIPAGASGLEQVRAYLYNVLALSEGRANALLALLEVKLYMYENKLSGDVLKRYLEEVHGTRACLRRLIDSGLADGSIRPDVNADDAVTLISNTYFGMLQRMEAVRYTSVDYNLASVRHEADVYIKNALRLLAST